MTETPQDERAVKLDAALADSQREERHELTADIDRQLQADERIVEALARHQETGTA